MTCALATIAALLRPRPHGKTTDRALRTLVQLTFTHRAAHDGERARRRAPPARPLARGSTRRRSRRGRAESDEPVTTSRRRLKPLWQDLHLALVAPRAVPTPRGGVGAAPVRNLIPQRWRRGHMRLATAAWAAKSSNALLLSACKRARRHPSVRGSPGTTNDSELERRHDTVAFPSEEQLGSGQCLLDSS